MINIRELKRYVNPFFITIRKDKILVNNKRMARLSKKKMLEIEDIFGVPVIYSKTYEYISTKVGRFITKHKLLSPKDVILVGFSGGKDSLLLLHMLEPYRRKMGIKIIAVTVDVNISGVRPWESERIDILKRECDMLDIPLVVLRYDKDVSYLSELLTKHSKGMGFSPCFSCSIVKRYLIGKYAKKLSVEENIPYEKIKIAYGHNLDDNSDTILSNIFKGERIKMMNPITKFNKRVVDFIEFKLELEDCTIIRPLLPVLEDDIIKALEECGIKYYKDKEVCPYSRERGDSIRRRCHEILEELEKEIPNIREMVVSSAIKTVEFYKKSS